MKSKLHHVNIVNISKIIIIYNLCINSDIIYIHNIHLYIEEDFF